MTTDQNDYFINRILDSLRDHWDVRAKTADETAEEKSLWRRATPSEYLTLMSEEFSDHVEGELRRQAHDALSTQKLDQAMFLLLRMSRLTEYRLSAKDQRPWGTPSSSST